MKRTRFMERKWLVIILLVSLIEPVHYFLLINYPPLGRTFMAYDSDEALVSGVMRSVEYNFDNPWSPGEKVFFNGALGSPYPYIPLGYLRILLGIDAILMNIIAKFVFFFLFLIVLFKALEALMPRNHELAFVLFLLPLGLMPLGYLLAFITGIDRFAEGFSFEFSILNNISRVYYFVPLITAFLSLIFFSKGRRIAAAIALGATFLFYPFFGFAFSGLLFLYSISGKHGRISDKVNQSVAELWKIYAIALVFLAPWVYARFTHPEYFVLYSENSLWWRAHLVGIIGSYFYFFFIILIANWGLVKKHWKIATLAGLFSIIIMMAELRALNVPPFNAILLPNFAVDITEIMLLALFGVAWFVLDSNLDRRHKFIILFALAFFPLSILNPKYVFWMQYRMGYILHIPLVMLAALYFDAFLGKVKSFGIERTTVLLVLGIFAVTSFLAYNYRYQMANRWVGSVFLEESDKESMLFLDKMNSEKTIVMASDSTNYFLPVWSGQYALYHPAESQYQGGGPNRSEKKKDVEMFYSDSMAEEKVKEIIQKYDVDYVFYGSEERKLGSPDFDSYPFLEKIYDNGAQIYKVNKSKLFASLT